MSELNTTEDPVREHSYDGIQEYDKNLPNWWLFTLYGTIAFSIVYWIYYHKTDLGVSPEADLYAALAVVEEAALKARQESGLGELNSDALWAMSQDPTVVAAGQETYATLCAACHGPDLKGLIGVNLIDDEWVHGNDPMIIRGTVLNGVIEKGMPPWGPILGEKKVNEVTAFVLSHHTKPSSG